MGDGMEAYIEYVILDNLSMNYVILKLLDITTGVKVGKFNKVAICILGTIFSIFLPYLYFNKVLLFVYKILVSIVLVMCIRRFRKFTQFLLFYMLFVMYTFLLGGMCLWVVNLMGLDYTMSGVLISSLEFPVGLLLSIIFCLIKLMYRWILIMKNKLRASNFIYKISITDGGESVNGIGFLDTGNNVRIDGCGVSIISLGLFLRLYKNMDIMDVVLKKVDIDNLKNVQYINIVGIGNEEKYLSFVVDILQVNGETITSPRLAVAMKNFGDYECILSSDIIKGGV